MNYLTAIKTAVFIFPIIALLFTIPFILNQYHKYGSINKYRVLIIYSFILYMVTIYFLVILPLPDIKEVTKPLQIAQLVPFSFITDFLNDSSFVINNYNTYLKVLSEPSFYVVAFNIIMTLPFGIYLRYYFQCSLKKTFLFSLMLSLFFELTQLSGLYSIYPYPYRLFDVDDLILNTFGGIIGYFLAAFLTFLPSRTHIDATALQKGQQVSGLRRITVFFFDLFLYLSISLVLSLLLKDIYYVTFIFYYIFIPFILDGKTLGSKFLNVKLVFPNYRFLRLILRCCYIYMYYFKLPIYCIYYLSITTYSIYINILALITICLFYFIHLVIILKKRTIYYDRLFKVEYKSTISVLEK